MKHKLFIFIPCLFGFALCQAQGVKGKPGEEIHSANGGDRLKTFHEKFIKSDLNGDGKLTVDEMHEYLNQNIKDGSKSDHKPSKAVNLKKLRGLKSRAYLNAFFIETNGGADVSGDGILTKAELLDYVLSQRKVFNEKGEQVLSPKVKKST